MVKCALVIPDCHIPWHDEKAFNLMLDIASFQHQLTPINQVIILGDFADCYNLSLHKKLPSHLQMTPRGLTDEISEVFYELSRIREHFPESAIIYLEGNHEFRLGRYIIEKCAEVHTMVKTLPELLHFDTLGVQWIPYGRHQLYQIFDLPLYARHVPWDGGKHTARQSVDKGQISLLYGHTHRKQRASIRTPIGDEVTCISMGWLGDRRAEIFDYMDHDTWGQGFGFVFAKGAQWFVEYVDIKHGQASYHGQIYC